MLRYAMLGVLSLGMHRAAASIYNVISRENAAGGDEALDASIETALGGRYRIQSTLGKGGMAVVYRAEDVVLGRAVALKTLHRQYAENPVFRQRFKQEARAMASLDHENIVRVYDIAEEEDGAFIVAECVNGRDLGSLLKRGRRQSEQFTRKVAEQLLEALAYAHRRGVIHRDIKPSNILITQNGVVKVADFGIARLVEEEEAGEPGEIIGSARYMSPEQLTGQKATPRSDVYSVGVLLYHCVTGAPPFVGEIKDLAWRQIHEKPHPPRELNKRLSPRMEAVILKALAKDPDDRYPAATAMLEDLQSGTAESPPSRNSRRFLIASVLTLLLMLGGGFSVAAGLKYADGATEGSGGRLLGGVEPVETRAAPQAPEASSTTPSVGAWKERASEEASVADGKKSAGYATVPDVRAYFDYSARRMLASRGFKVQVVRDPRYGYADRGIAWATDPAFGTRAPRGSTVILYTTPKNGNGA